jgi:hypothetical protein
MSAIESQCDRCKGFAGFEEAPSGQVCDVCELWVCDDCTNWSIDRRHDKEMGSHDNVCLVCFPN